ncbi:helix-turn-helix domain-containing protein [Janibacter sp. Soil728]|uniref:helix-turn-helix domain-containing protein n=1 Tax=Janibacter sp. Soil728 TaxID=1736393 RepID=UPI000B24D551|nr:helix-turn-helix domain-containing protein [Janibacter sp. Soil728]
MPSDEPLTQVTHLLELLVSDVPIAQLADAPAPEAAKDLALRIGGLRETHRRRESAQSALLDTARELASESSPSIVLEAIVRRARTLLGTDLAYLTLYDADAGDTFMRVTDGSVSADFQSLRLSLGDGLGGLVASTHKPYWTADYSSDQRFSHTSTIDHGVGDEGIIAICGTPLIVESTFVGVLFAANRTPRPFSHAEIGLLGNLAALAAIAIVQTRALADAEHALAALSEAHDIVRQQAVGVERAAAAHDRFASVVLEGGGVGDVTQALVDLLGGWAVLFDGAGERRSVAGVAPEAEKDPLLAHPVVDRARHEVGRLVEDDGIHAIGVIAAHEQLGTLVVGAPDALEDADQRTVERAAVVTALVLLFERQADDARQSERDRVLADLLTARGGRDDRTGYLRSASVEPRDPWCLLVVRGGDPTQQRALALTVSTILGDGTLVGTHEDSIVAIVPGENPDALARTLAERVTRGPQITVGGCGPVGDVDDLPGALEEGSRTVRALVALGRAGTGAAATELGFAGLIVGADPDVHDYVRSVLGPVLDYDDERGSDLAGTLVAYFAAGSSPRHAAGSLHVHVNTVAQRLGRIAALLGDDWQHPDRALEIQLALRMRRLLESP